MFCDADHGAASTPTSMYCTSSGVKTWQRAPYKREHGTATATLRVACNKPLRAEPTGCLQSRPREMQSRPREINHDSTPTANNRASWNSLKLRFGLTTHPSKRANAHDWLNILAAPVRSTQVWAIVAHWLGLWSTSGLRPCTSCPVVVPLICRYAVLRLAQYQCFHVSISVWYW